MAWNACLVQSACGSLYASVRIAGEVIRAICGYLGVTISLQDQVACPSWSAAAGGGRYLAITFLSPSLQRLASIGTYNTMSDPRGFRGSWETDHICCKQSALLKMFICRRRCFQPTTRALNYVLPLCPGNWRTTYPVVTTPVDCVLISTNISDNICSLITGKQWSGKNFHHVDHHWTLKNLTTQH